MVKGQTVKGGLSPVAQRFGLAGLTCYHPSTELNIGTIVHSIISRLISMSSQRLWLGGVSALYIAPKLRKF